jgi:hypothetical protein
MGLDHSPLIVTDGLVLYFDAANTRSYSGSGITLNGLVSGIGATIGGGVGFTTINGGSIQLNSASTGYIQIPPITWRSICMWIKLSDSNAHSHYLIDGRTGVANSWFYSVTPSGAIGSAWTQFYVNAIQRTISGSNGLSNTTLFERNKWLHIYLELSGVGTGDVHIFSRFSNNETSTGDISNVQFYNRVLSATEIVQNYNATKRRYGL